MECVIIVKTTKSGVPSEKGTHTRYVRVHPVKRTLSYAADVADATVFPNERWAQTHIERHGIPPEVASVQSYVGAGGAS